MRLSTKKLAIITLFGTLIFVTKTFVPSPLNKMLIGIQSLMLGLSALLIGDLGATLVSLLGGSLSTLWNISLAPFTFSFAIFYGLLVDAFFFLFKIKTVEGKVKSYRLVAAMALSTMIVGFLSYYLTVHLMELIPRNPPMEVGILIVGKSGVGKSECALELVERGHRLVADDVVDIQSISDTLLIGSGAKLIRHHMEIRGLGIINIKQLFGVGAIRDKKQIQLVVSLEDWNSKKE